MAYNKEFDEMILTDLVSECEAKGIEVDVEDDAEALRKKLGKKPV